MSGVEVAGTIGAVLGICQTTLDLYNTYQDVRGLPRAFLQIQDKIPLIMVTLEQVRTEADSAGTTKERGDAMMKVVRHCKDNAQTLNLILERLKIDSPAKFELEKYVNIIRGWKNKPRVEDLLKKILEDVKLLADNQTLNAVSEEQVKKLSEALEAVDHLKRASPSAPDYMLEAHAGTRISQEGPGQQFNLLGETTNSGQGNIVFGTFNASGK